jgi:flagellar hook-length control protein FliK
MAPALAAHGAAEGALAEHGLGDAAQFAAMLAGLTAAPRSTAVEDGAATPAPVTDAIRADNIGADAEGAIDALAAVDAAAVVQAAGFAVFNPPLRPASGAPLPEPAMTTGVLNPPQLPQQPQHSLPETAAIASADAVHPAPTIPQAKATEPAHTPPGVQLPRAVSLTVPVAATLLQPALPPADPLPSAPLAAQDTARPALFDPEAGPPARWDSLSTAPATTPNAPQPTPAPVSVPLPPFATAQTVTAAPKVTSPPAPAPAGQPAVPDPVIATATAAFPTSQESRVRSSADPALISAATPFAAAAGPQSAFAPPSPSMPVISASPMLQPPLPLALPSDHSLATPADAGVAAARYPLSLPVITSATPSPVDAPGRLMVDAAPPLFDPALAEMPIASPLSTPATAAPPPSSIAPVTLAAVPQVIVAAALNSTATGAELRLDPVELGALSFSIDLQATGLVVTILAERPETLDLMRRHAEQLLADLRQSGFAGASLNFGQPQQDPGGQRQPATHTPAEDQPVTANHPAARNAAAFQPPQAAPATFGGLDLRL